MDQAIVLYLNQFVTASPPLSGAAVFFAQYAPYLVAALFVFFVIFRVLLQRDKWLLLAEGFGAALVARGAVEVIRLFIERPRPFIADPDIVALLEKTSSSFPSGHAAFFLAFSTVVYLHNKRWGVWFFIASTVIGLARITAGVHYPTDILGGAVLGIAVGLGMHQCFRKISRST